MQHTDERLLRRSEVEEIVGLSRTAVYRKMRRGEFPEPLALGSKCVRWRLSEIEAWMESRPRATGRDPGNQPVAA